MAVFVDPKSGERFENDAEGAEASAAQYGLVPLAQFEADTRPFLDSALEAGQAVGNTLLRPLEAIGEALPRSRMAEIGERVGDTWSPSSADSRRIAQEHPIASALPLAGELLLPGGALVQGAAGALAGAAETSFQGGAEYGAINPDDLLAAAALGGGLAAAAPVARGVAAGVGAARRGAAKLSDLGSGAVAKALGGKLGQAVTKAAAEEAVETGLKGVGAAVGGAVGGTPGMAVGWVAGRLLNKRFGPKLVDAVTRAAKRGEPVAGMGVKPGVAAAEAAPAAAPKRGWSPWEPFEAPPKPPINPESVTIGTGVGPVFQRAEREMSAGYRNAKAILERRRGQAGNVVLTPDAPEAALEKSLGRWRGRAERIKGDQEAYARVTEQHATLQRQLDDLHVQEEALPPEYAWEEGLFPQYPTAKSLRDAHRDVARRIKDASKAFNAAERASTKLAGRATRDSADTYPIENAVNKYLKAKGIERHDLDDLLQVEGALEMPDDELAKLLIERARAAPRSPVDLSGKSLEDLGVEALDEATDRAATLKGLRESPEFAATGRAPRSFDREGHEKGITIVQDTDGKLVMRDGRHRFSVAREKGSPTIWGTVIDGKTGKQVYRGDIPLGGAPERAVAAADAATVPPKGRAARAAGKLEPLPERDVTPTKWYPDSNRARSEYGDAMYPHREAQRSEAARMRALAREHDLGSVTVGDGPNFSLGDIAKSPMGVVTGLGGVAVAGNVLARAERRARERISSTDLADLDEPERREALRRDGARYREESARAVADTLAEKTDAAVKARAAALGKALESVADANGAQRQFAASMTDPVGRAAHELRMAGDTERADQLDAIADRLTELDVAHEQGAPETHDPGRVLGDLEDAYQLLRAGVQTEAGRATLTELAEGTQRSDLWGAAGERLAQMRVDDDQADAVDILDTSAGLPAWRQNVRANIEAARAQADDWGLWGVDTERLVATLDRVEAALDAGDSLDAEFAAAGIEDHDAGADDGQSGPMGEIMAAVAAETGAEGVDTVLTESLRSAMGDQQRAYRYDEALRSVQRTADLDLRRAARGMVGLGSREAPVAPDASNDAFSEGYPDDLAAFESRRDMIARMAEDPTTLANAMAESYGEMVRTHPDVYAAVTDLVVRATDILTAALPPSLQVSLQSPGGLPPSVDDVRAFARVYMAVTEPSLYLQDLASGQAWPEQSQAFAQMYPDRWQALSQEAMSAAQQRGWAMTPQDKTYLDLTFDVGNTIGGLWSEAGAQAIREANTAMAQRGQEQAQGIKRGSPEAAMPTSATSSLAGGPSNTPVS